MLGGKLPPPRGQFVLMVKPRPQLQPPSAHERARLTVASPRMPEPWQAVADCR
jgi:hypothetical protein